MEIYAVLQNLVSWITFLPPIEEIFQTNKELPDTDNKEIFQTNNVTNFDEVWLVAWCSNPFLLLKREKKKLSFSTGFSFYASE